jgi:dephospho-CoA kinase
LKIENNIIKYYLKNVYFITGTAYAGKSTTVKMLSERYDMIFCGENYHSAVSDIVATPEAQPDISYINNLTDWKEFVTRTPEEYERWIYSVGKEAAEFEVAELIALSQNKKVIVDTNIPVDILKEIADYNHVAVMLSPQSMSVERFFDREDPDKQFLLSVIDSCEEPETVMKNYRQGLARINSQEHYDEYANSGFFTVIREDNGEDTREKVCDIIAKHFGLI